MFKLICRTVLACAIVYALSYMYMLSPALGQQADKVIEDTSDPQRYREEFGKSILDNR